LPKKVSRKRRPAAKQSKRLPTGKVWDSPAILAAIVDSSDDAIIGKTLDGTITSWNPGAERIYGYRANEVIGRSISILAPRDRGDEIPAILEKIRRGQSVEHYESVRVTKAKRRVDVSITVSPIRDARGKIVGASAITRDLSSIQRAHRELRESESRAQAIFRSAAQAILIVDAAGRIVTVNPVTRSMFGYSAEELVGQPVELLVPQEFRGGHKAHRDSFFRSPQARPMGLGLELRARHKDGTEFFVEISLSYIDSAQGPLGVAFVSDISRRRADEQAIRQQREDLRHLSARLMTAQDDERRRIARDLHDDLSQQLAFLAMDLGRLGMNPSAQGMASELRPLQLRAVEISQAVRRISHELHPSVLDDIGLEAALEQYCEEFEQRSGIATRFISRNVPESLRPEIARSIYHIAQECLHNVSKHARTEKVSVTLEFANNLLRLMVKDQGIGLSVDQPESKGIGFVAMKERANLVNGRLSIQSETGAGTEVSVEVPMSASA
jgi:PAS domain S-box-containing protein